jgi:transaldolase
VARILVNNLTKPAKEHMKATQQLHDLGQSLWLDHVTRDLFDSGLLRHCIEEWSVTGVTCDMTRFGRAIRNGTTYDAAIRRKTREEKLGEDLIFELLLEDLRYTADLLRPIYDRTDGVDGWVSMGISPLVVHDAESILAAARNLYVRARRPNVFITIPGTEAGLSAVEEAIAENIPVNVTLLFSREHYQAAAEAFLRGIERRIASGLTPNVSSIASVRVNAWDAAVKDKVDSMRFGPLGLAMARCTYKAFHQFLGSARWQRAVNAGARPQRLLWVGAGADQSDLADVLSIEALAAPLTVNTLSTAALKTFAERGKIDGPMPADGYDCETVLESVVQSGIDLAKRADLLQKDGEQSLVAAWIELMTVLATRSAALATAGVIENELQTKTQ